jgi:hypothetical protein
LTPTTEAYPYPGYTPPPTYNPYPTP